jgi:DNA repair protein RadC
MRCTCGFGDDLVRYARVEHGKLKCPYCSGEIACETAPPPSLRSSAEAFALLSPTMRRRKQESFWVFYLDTRHRVIGKQAICRGTLAACIVHPREIFGSAMTRHAAAIILAHNHPSGDATPSPEDERLTTRLVEVGKLLGIPVLDHLVVTADSYFSFRDTGAISCD